MMSSPQDSDVPVTSSPSDSRPLQNSPPDSSPLQTSPPNSRPLQIHSHDVRRVLFKRGEKFEWKEWGSLTTVSLHLKAHIITMPFFASRLMYTAPIVSCVTDFEVQFLFLKLKVSNN